MKLAREGAAPAGCHCSPWPGPALSLSANCHCPVPLLRSPLPGLHFHILFQHFFQSQGFSFNLTYSKKSLRGPRFIINYCLGCPFLRHLLWVTQWNSTLRWNLILCLKASKCYDDAPLHVVVAVYFLKTYQMIKPYFPYFLL